MKKEIWTERLEILDISSNSVYFKNSTKEQENIPTKHNGGETASTRMMKLRLHTEQLSARKKDGKLK